MHWKDASQLIQNLLRKYSLRDLAQAVGMVLRDVWANANLGTKILIAALGIPCILLLIVVLHVIIVLKWVFKNFLNLARALLTVALEEVHAYWSYTRLFGTTVLADLSASMDYLSKYIVYLLTRLSESESRHLRPQPAVPMHTAVGEFLAWSVVVLVATVMSTLLLTTFMVGSPIVHRQLRLRMTRGIPEAPLT